jgi:hypothetical protein
VNVGFRNKAKDFIPILRRRKIENGTGQRKYGVITWIRITRLLELTEILQDE